MIIELLENILTKCFNDSGYEAVKAGVVISNRPDLCDYQCNDVFKLAKMNQTNPIELGTTVVEAINNHLDFDKYFDKVEFVKPGFINITVNSKFINKFLNDIYKDIKSIIEIPKKETYVVDFGGANVAKPLHVGHMSTILFGESIARTIRFLESKTITDVHLGDYGLNIGQVIYGILKDGLLVDDIDIKYLDKIYPQMSALCKENEEVKEECARITLELQEGNEEYRKFWAKIVEISVQDIKKNYDYLGANFDYWYGEASAYDYLAESEEILNSKKLLTPSEGALVVDVSESTDKKELPPLLFKKTNGAYLYPSTDISTILQRKKDFNPDHVLYVVDNRQSLHFEQVFRVCDKAGIMEKEKLEHLPYGTVNGADGKPYKTRSGNTPKLEELFASAKEIFISKKETNSSMSEKDLNILVNAILKFAVLQNSRERDYIFDLNKFSEVSGKTGPYILYTYLRIKKILDNENYDSNMSDNIYNNIDRDLRMKLLEYPNAISNAFKDRMPHHIAEYVYNLCVSTNAFYQYNHINDLEDEVNKNDWLFVLSVTNKVIKTMLELLAIDIPSIM